MLVLDSHRGVYLVVRVERGSYNLELRYGKVLDLTDMRNLPWSYLGWIVDPNI